MYTGERLGIRLTARCDPMTPSKGRRVIYSQYVFREGPRKILQRPRAREVKSYILTKPSLFSRRFLAVAIEEQTHVRLCLASGTACLPSFSLSLITAGTRHQRATLARLSCTQRIKSCWHSRWWPPLAFVSSGGGGIRTILGYLCPTYILRSQNNHPRLSGCRAVRNPASDHSSWASSRADEAGSEVSRSLQLDIMASRVNKWVDQECRISWSMITREIAKDLQPHIGWWSRLIVR